MVTMKVVDIPVTFRLRIVSNGRYRSVKHRVFASSKPRIWIATFSAPADETVVGPTSELLTAKERPRFKSIKFSEFKKSFYYAGWAKAPSGKEHLGHLLVDQDYIV